MNGLGLFAGIGGFELGMQLAVPTYRAVALVEKEAFNLACLAKRMQEGHIGRCPVWSDVETFRPEPWRGIVDIVTAGYPCQPFSSCGLKLGTADPRWLWPHVARIVRAIEPEWVFIENVERHLAHGFEHAWDDLRRMGFQLAGGIFAAVEVGAPHLRRRLFVLAHASDIGRRQRPHHLFPGQPLHASGRPPLGQADCSGSQQPNQQPRLPHQAGQALGHPHGGGGRRQEGRLCPGRDGHPGTGEALGYALGHGCQGQHAAGPTEAPALGASPPAPWPPARNDEQGWGLVTRHAPALEPVVSGMADGCPYRVDRVRALGDAVVPAVVAHAWRTLARAHLGE